MLLRVSERMKNALELLQKVLLAGTGTILVAAQCEAHERARAATPIAPFGQGKAAISELLPRRGGPAG